MLKILRDKMLALGRGEEGVAMVVTLGIFMFLYVACASIYAVGWAVKEKLLLQRACDAAAYSAAVVQADTFSRIATINRAMSWTYQQMTKRQMDYIVWQWLEEVMEHYCFDLEEASDYAKRCNRCLSSPSGKCNWPTRCYRRGVGYDTVWTQRSDGSLADIKLKNRWFRYSEIQSMCRSFLPQHLRNQRSSFYSPDAKFDTNTRALHALGSQIDADLLNIRAMGVAVDALARGLPDRVNASAAAILKANIPQYMGRGDSQYFISQNLSPRSGDNRYFDPFRNNLHDELIFLSISDSVVKSPSDIFKSGNDVWFCRGDERGMPEDESAEGSREMGRGIHRTFNRQMSADVNPFVAAWQWWSKGWTCDTKGGIHYRVPNGDYDRIRCSHSHGKCGCTSANVRGIVHGDYNSGVSQHRQKNRVWYTPRVSHSFSYRTMSANTLADSDYHSVKYQGFAEFDQSSTGRYDRRFRGCVLEHGREIPVYARPLKIRQNYFGKDGTITVGLARRNENPWFVLLGRVTSGIYSAFSPVENSWTYCFASAKAGYKTYHIPEDWRRMVHNMKRNASWMEDWEECFNGTVRVSNGPRDYCIDWKPEYDKLYDVDYERDEQGNVVWRDADGNVTESGKGHKTIVHYYENYDNRIIPTWRKSWNLVQDDWDAVMVPVRQGGSRAREVANYSLLDWRNRLMSGQYASFTEVPDRYEPAWLGLNRDYLASLVNNANWIVLSGAGRPNASVTAGPTDGDVGDPLKGRLAGRIWEDYRQRGISPPPVTGTGQWNVGRPGARLNWNRIGDEMYH